MNLCPNLGFYSFRGTVWLQASERKGFLTVNFKITVEVVGGEVVPFQSLEQRFQSCFYRGPSGDRARPPGYAVRARASSGTGTFLRIPWSSIGRLVRFLLGHLPSEGKKVKMQTSLPRLNHTTSPLGLIGFMGRVIIFRIKFRTATGQMQNL